MARTFLMLTLLLMPSVHRTGMLPSRWYSGLVAKWIPLLVDHLESCLNCIHSQEVLPSESVLIACWCEVFRHLWWCVCHPSGQGLLEEVLCFCVIMWFLYHGEGNLKSVTCTVILTLYSFVFNSVMRVRVFCWILNAIQLFLWCLFFCDETKMYSFEQVAVLPMHFLFRIRWKKNKKLLVLVHKLYSSATEIYFNNIPLKSSHLARLFPTWIRNQVATMMIH